MGSVEFDDFETGLQRALSGSFEGADDSSDFSFGEFLRDGMASIKGDRARGDRLPAALLG